MTGFSRRRTRTIGRALGAAAVSAALVATAVYAQAVPGRPPGKAAVESWQNEVAQVPTRSTGCFTAAYPQTDWQQVQCTSAPNHPMPPRFGPPPQTIGNTFDVAARVPSGFISNAIGSFENVSAGISESGPIGNTGPNIANAYTLQMNTNFFASTACAGSPNPNCRGWEQFVFENTGSFGRAFIQYWLLQYNAACPAGQGWNQFSFTGDTDIYCWKNNSGGTVPVPNQPVTQANLSQLSLSGNVSAAGDSVTMFVGSTAYTRVGDNAVNAAGGWNTAEFNIFGDGGNSAGGGTATFNSGASMTVRTRTIYGGTAAPLCVAQGFTGEKNNLSFGTPAPASTGPGPAVRFLQNTVGGAAAPCSAATTVGDTHLSTFGGLLYDFQATGDFELASVGSDFEVQSRQISGAPNWPDAAVNSAVATRMGKTRVALCGKEQLVVDGRRIDLPDGGQEQVGDGVWLTRTGNRYLVTDAEGNRLRAEVKNGYIDATVGVGTWPSDVRGLLGHPDHSVKLLEGGDGTVYGVPLSFEDTYRYGDSWRVKADDSLLLACGRPDEEANPGKPFHLENLEPKLREEALSVCLRYQISDPALLNACNLDVAVLGRQAAAVYQTMTPPVLDGNS
jgi:hypothetical protein